MLILQQEEEEEEDITLIGLFNHGTDDTFYLGHPVEEEKRCLC